MPDYLTVTCRIAAAKEEFLAVALERWPVLGCEVAEAGADIDVTIYLEEDRAKELPVVTEGLRALGAREVGTAHFAEQDWLAEYRRHAAPRAIGNLFWVDPHPTAPTPAPDGRIHMVIEPRQAFGTGSHESTQLVLLLLEEMPVFGRRVLDVGTGSGILALAARSLGARSAVGFDIDGEAIFVARQIAAQQPKILPVALFAGTTAALRHVPYFDLILANLIPAQVEPMLAELRTMLAPGGTLVLSGLMVDQRAAVEAELARFHLGVVRARELEEWVALVCSSA